MIIVCQKKFPKFDTKIYAVSYYMGKVNITQNTQYPLCKKMYKAIFTRVADVMAHHEKLLTQ